MIPLRVTMTGWMRYRDEQTADFSQGRLIAICGENGAGKSSIFDAITFALYGFHRLSRSHAEVVSEHADLASVEFEFEAANARYMVKRSVGIRREKERDADGIERETRKVTANEQSLWALDDGSDWTQVPGTEKQDALDRTLSTIVRLSADAFTSSFLLQQGEATAILDAQPKERFEIVSSLIGLKEYEALRIQANEARKAEDQRLGDLEVHLAGFEGVDEASLERLRADAAASAEREATTASARDAAREREAGALVYARLAGEIAALDDRIAGAEELIAQRDQIENDARLFETISSAIGAATSVRASLADETRARAASESARAQADAIDIDALAAAQAAATKHDADAVVAAADAERGHAAAARADREALEFSVAATAIIDARASIERHASQIAEYEASLAKLPHLEKTARELDAVKDALPPLFLLKDARERVETLTAAAPAAALATLRKQQAAGSRDLARAEKQIETAEATAAEARRQAAGAQAAVSTLETQLRDRKGAAAEAKCRRCGQPVDKKRAKAEVAALTEQLTAARGRAKTAAAAQKAAEAGVAGARQAHRSLLAAETARAGEIAAAEGRVADLERALEIASQQQAAFAKKAPVAIARGVTPAASVAVLAKVIAAHAGTPKQAEAASKELDALRGVEGQRKQALGERDRALADLARHESRLNGRLKDVPLAARSLDAARKRLTAAESALAEARRNAEETRAAAAVATQQLSSARERRAALEAEARQREGEAAGHRRTAEVVAENLRDLKANALDDPDGVLATLESHREGLAGAPTRKIALEGALSERAACTGERAGKQGEIDRIPEAHRIDAEEARAAHTAAEAAAGLARRDRDAAQHALATFEARLDEVRRLQADHAVAKERRRLLRKLVRFLGKEGLQGVLVHEALTTIASHANAFLQRLTGGTLRLELRRGRGDELELRAVDSTCMREPRSVRALSGSQKFRCAVAIASGIGQYAGAGGMRSIVIDEGFGSLDPEGQRQMIDELKNLADHMDKVIVVSHLEAFTDRMHFPDQIVVTADGDGSRIARAC